MAMGSVLPEEQQAVPPSAVSVRAHMLLPVLDRTVSALEVNLRCTHRGASNLYLRLAPRTGNG
jgi:hypothetical protein